MATAKATEKFYLRKTLLEKIPLSATTIYRMEQKGEFPKRLQLSAGKIAWLASEVDAWINSRPAAT